MTLLPWPEIAGRVCHATTGTGLADCVLTAHEPGNPRRVYARTTSQLNGDFFLVFLDEEPHHFTLLLTDPDGRELARIDPLAGDERFVPRLFEVRPEDASPPEPAPELDVLAALAADYPHELAALEALGIRTFAELQERSIDALVEASGLPEERWEAFRLHGEMVGVPGFDRDAAFRLREAGLKTREEIALRGPEALLDIARELDPAMVYSWASHAEGLDPALFPVIDDDELVAAHRELLERLRADLPEALISDPEAALHPVIRYETVARARTLMESAGISELAALGTITIKGEQVIEPGTYLAPPRRSPIGGGPDLAEALFAQGGSYQKVKGVELLAGGVVHFKPNPVSEALIIGSGVNFLQGSRLIIGRSVTSLTILTLIFDGDATSEITYETRDETPLAPPPIQPPRADDGTPFNDKYVYVPDGTTATDGRPGGNGQQGRDGIAGSPGDVLGPVPALEILAVRCKNGGPRIDLRGHRGGEGQAAQAGGHGSDGAAGAPAVTGFLHCWRDSGIGGTGGNGGDGGNGGPGGRGGTGGTVTISLFANSTGSLTSPVVVAGGPGGWGGSPGGPGRPGEGGVLGRGALFCGDGVGQAPGGRYGKPGNGGATGARGPDGVFIPRILATQDWLATLAKPFILRVNPGWGPAGRWIRLVARLVRSQSVSALLNQKPAQTGIVKIDTRPGQKSVIDIRIPDQAIGRQLIQLREANPGGTVLSNIASYRVTPALTAITPQRALPETSITIRGSGFQPGAQVRLGGLSLATHVAIHDQLSFVLPDHETIGLGAGTYAAVVINPDGGQSGSLPFELETNILVRLKAWRVFADVWVSGGGGFGGGPPGTGFDEAYITKFLTRETHHPDEVFRSHSIRFNLDPKIETVRMRGDYVASWPVSTSATRAVVMATDGSGSFKHFDPDAINLYFVGGIRLAGAGAFADVGQPIIIYRDTVRGRWGMDWANALMASHEIGHVLGLLHVCENDGSPSVFGRVCQAGDEYFLMQPHILNHPFIPNDQARIARRNARWFHRK